MSSFSETALNKVDESAATDEHDHASVIRRSEEKPVESNVRSLAALTGLYMVKEAYDFFEELQADLSSIKIQGEDFDKLWCTLDWQRYIIALWVKQIIKRRVSGRRWPAIKESWEVIIQATVTLNLRYASPSSTYQRPTSAAHPQSIAFDKVPYAKKFVKNPFDSYHADDEVKLMESIIQATEKDACNTPLFHEKTFTGWIESAMDDLATTHSAVEIQEQRRSGAEPGEFGAFTEVLDKQIKGLIALLTTEEREEVYMALDRALRAALEYDNLLFSDVRAKIRYLQFYKSLIAAWPFSNKASTTRVKTVLQSRVQETFEQLITHSFHSYDLSKPECFPYTVENLQDILALGANIRGKLMNRRNCSLFAAATANDYPLFKALVHAGAPYTWYLTYKSFPLQAAARSGNLDIVAFLLDKYQYWFRLKINYADEWGLTALHEAAKNCHESVIEFLLNHPGIDVNLRDCHGHTPFLLAVLSDADPSKKYAAMKAFLRSKRVDFNAKGFWGMDKSKSNALHMAATRNDDTLKIIVRHVRGINDRDRNGNTPLHHAVISHSKQNLDILLSHGADPTISNEDGYTPLLLACSWHHLESMELLLSLPESLKHQCYEPMERRRSRCQPTFTHCSPVAFVLDDYRSASQEDRAHMVLALRIILTVKPDLEMRNDIGQSVLNYVIHQVDECALLDLLQAGADVNTQDVYGRTPLHGLIGAWCPFPEKVKMLLEWGADIFLEDEDGETAVTSGTYGGMRPMELLEVIKNHIREKAKEQQQKNLQIREKQSECDP